MVRLWYLKWEVLERATFSRRHRVGFPMFVYAPLRCSALLFFCASKIGKLVAGKEDSAFRERWRNPVFSNSVSFHHSLALFFFFSLISDCPSSFEFGRTLRIELISLGRVYSWASQLPGRRAFPLECLFECFAPCQVSVPRLSFSWSRASSMLMTGPGFPL